MYEVIEAIAYEMRLFGIKGSAERRCQEALASGMHPSELVRLILEDEKDARRQAVAKRLAHGAKFRSPCNLEDWDIGTERGLSKAKLKELSLINFFHKKQNLIIEGKTGVGKTHLAIALGKRVCDEGASTRFFSTNLFFEEATAERSAGRYLQFIRRLAKSALIILDDFALRNYTHDEANTLLELLEERYAKGVVIAMGAFVDYGRVVVIKSADPDVLKAAVLLAQAKFGASLRVESGGEVLAGTGLGKDLEKRQNAPELKPQGKSRGPER